MQPEETKTLEENQKQLPRQRHFLALFFLSFMWGTFGVDRMYLGKWGTGILKLVTFGGFGIWTIVDLIIIMTGTMKDKQGRLALQAEDYKKFAGRTILIFAITLGLFILITGLMAIFAIFQVLTMVQDGTFNLTSVPGLDQIPGIQNLAPTPIDELGL